MVDEGNKTPGQGEPCRIAEIVQFICNIEKDANDRPQTHCFPIPRIFKLHVLTCSARRSAIDASITRCRGSPAVEITKLVDIDLATGEVVIPPDASR